MNINSFFFCIASGLSSPVSCSTDCGTEVVEPRGACPYPSCAAGCIPTREVCCADNAAKCGTIDKVPEQRTSRRREATKRCTEDLCTQHWGNDDLGDAPEEP